MTSDIKHYYPFSYTGFPSCVVIGCEEEEDRGKLKTIMFKVPYVRAYSVSIRFLILVLHDTFDTDSLSEKACLQRNQNTLSEKKNPIIRARCAPNLKYEFKIRDARPENVPTRVHSIIGGWHFPFRSHIILFARFTRGSNIDVIIRLVGGPNI